MKTLERGARRPLRPLLPAERLMPRVGGAPPVWFDPALVLANAVPAYAASSISANAVAASYGKPLLGKKTKSYALGAIAIGLLAYLNLGSLETQLIDLLSNFPDLGDLTASGPLDIGGIEQGDLTLPDADLGSARSAIDPALERAHLSEAARSENERAVEAALREELKGFGKTAVDKVAESYVSARKVAQELASKVEDDLARKATLLQRVQGAHLTLAAVCLALADVGSAEAFQVWAGHLSEALKDVSSRSDDLAENLRRDDAGAFAVPTEAQMAKLKGKALLEATTKRIILDAFREPYERIIQLMVTAFEGVRSIAQASARPVPDLSAFVDITGDIFAAAVVTFGGLREGLPKVQERTEAASHRWRNWMLGFGALSVALVGAYQLVFEDWWRGAEKRGEPPTAIIDPKADRTSVPVVPAEPEAPEERQDIAAATVQDRAPAAPIAVEPELGPERIELTPLDSLIDFDTVPSSPAFVVGVQEGIAVHGPDGRRAALHRVFDGRRIAARGDRTSQIVLGAIARAPLEVAMSPDGRAIAATGQVDRILTVLDSKTGERRFAVDLPPLAKTLRRGMSVRRRLGAQLTFSPDSAVLAAGTGFSPFRLDKAHLWDAQTGQRSDLIVPEGRFVTAFAFESDRTLYAAAFTLGEEASAPVLLSYDVRRPRRAPSLQRLQGLDGAIAALSVAEDGAVLAISRGGVIASIDPASGEEDVNEAVFDWGARILAETGGTFLLQGCDEASCAIERRARDGTLIERWTFAHPGRDLRLADTLSPRPGGGAAAIAPAGFEVVLIPPPGE